MKHLTWTRWLPLIGAMAAALFTFGSGVAQASTCGDTWTGAGHDGLWSTAGNWSSAEVPGNTYNNVAYQPDVCIPAGNFTALLTYETTVDSISVGSGSTLEIWGEQGFTHGGLTLNDQDNGTGIASGANVVLGIGTSTNTTHGGFNALSGTLVNDGTILSANTTDETPNYIYGNFVNNGTLTIDNAFDGTVASWTLGGTVNVASGQSVTLDGPNSGTGSLTLTGTVINNGSLTLSTPTINLTAASGTDSGNPIILFRDGGILSPSGSGSGTFHIEDGNAQLGSNIASGYTVWGSGIPGFTHGDITTTGSYTNHGTLELGSLDGTHGTLTVPSGDTFTNDSNVIFENTANGPDGLNGALVNNGSVSVQNNFQGSGEITNNGTFELTSASGTNQAASFTQGSGGTLQLDVTGGSSPVVPGFSLTSTATTGGKLVVDTTGGTVTGTFPMITASQQSGTFGTSFSGENYTLGYKSGTVSLTGPAAAATTTPITTASKPVATTPKAPTVTSISGGKRIVEVKLKCSKGTNCASYTVAASVKVTEKLHGKRQTVTETVAKRIGTLNAGRSATLKIAIGAASVGLLRTRSRATARITVTVTAAGRVVKSKTVTVRR
jgi:hypothetical protein